MSNWNGKTKAITFSFDDGVTQDVRLVELLNKYNLRCTFNVNSELLGKEGGWTAKNGVYVNHNKIQPSQVASLYKGHEVAVHTLTHPNLTTLDEAQIIHQVEDDRNNLSELVGYEVFGMAYPCGGVNNDDRVAELIKTHTGIRYSRTITDNARFDPQENLFRFQPTVRSSHLDQMMELAREFLEMKTETPKIFYVWGHSYEMDFAVDWTRLEEFFKLISQREDVFYGTNREILLGSHGDRK